MGEVVGDTVGDVEGDRVGAVDGLKDGDVVGTTDSDTAVDMLTTIMARGRLMLNLITDMEVIMVMVMVTAMAMVTTVRSFKNLAIFSCSKNYKYTILLNNWNKTIFTVLKKK